ncbi:MAG: Heptaprenyl diphosphate synthase component I [Tenericutes bacterium ADurb.Bin087]|nr:MAG: Heptaprenyl diphosphate synthase component I [Tenericutes bacterium ADurb.Bin087]
MSQVGNNMKKDRKFTTRKLVHLAVFLALGVVFNIVENYIVFIPALPGVKLGLANSIGLILLALYGPAEFVAIGLLRVLLSGTFSGFGTSFMLSLSGFLVSSAIVLISYVFNKLSIYGLSLLSAVTHGVGQVVVIALMYENVLMLNYLIVMMISGIITGLLIAALAKIVILRLKMFKEEECNYEVN